MLGATELALSQSTQAVNATYRTVYANSILVGTYMVTNAHSLTPDTVAVAVGVPTLQPPTATATAGNGNREDGGGGGGGEELRLWPGLYQRKETKASYVRCDLINASTAHAKDEFPSRVWLLEHTGVASAEACDDACAADLRCTHSVLGQGDATCALYAGKHPAGQGSHARTGAMLTCRSLTNGRVAFGRTSPDGAHVLLHWAASSSRGGSVPVINSIGCASQLVVEETIAVGAPSPDTCAAACARYVQSCCRAVVP